jgi:uncharacterized membrane protein
MATARTTARAANVALAAMLTGNELGSRVLAHPALDDLPVAAHVRAEQALTRRYGRFMPAVMSATLASYAPVLALERDRTSPRALLGLAGLASYGAMLALTLRRNVPINERLLALDPDRPEDQAEFHALRARWDRLHTARNALDVAGMALTVAAAVRADAG